MICSIRKIVRARRFQRAADTHLRPEHGIGEEVDRQPLAHAEPRSADDRLHPARLVEAVDIRRRHLRQHAGRRLAVRPAHQRLMGVDGVAGAIDDRLIRILELEPDGFAIAAA
ncbi:MAG: hypothetical protein ABWY27_14240 [Telluria sp.]